jgi:hypothetical protein
MRRPWSALESFTFSNFPGGLRVSSRLILKADLINCATASVLRDYFSTLLVTDFDMNVADFS